MNLQEIIVYIILALVAITIIVSLYRMFTRKDKCCNCDKHCMCDKSQYCNLKKKSVAR